MVGCFRPRRTVHRTARAARFPSPLPVGGASENERYRPPRQRGAARKRGPGRSLREKSALPSSTMFGSSPNRFSIRTRRQGELPKHFAWRALRSVVREASPVASGRNGVIGRAGGEQRETAAKSAGRFDQHDEQNDPHRPSQRRNGAFGCTTPSLPCVPLTPSRAYVQTAAYPRAPFLGGTAAVCLHWDAQD